MGAVRDKLCVPLAGVVVYAMPDNVVRHVSVQKMHVQTWSCHHCLLQVPPPVRVIQTIHVAIPVQMKVMATVMRRNSKKFKTARHHILQTIFGDILL